MKKHNPKKKPKKKMAARMQSDKQAASKFQLENISVSRIKSVVKYVYLVAFFMLLSGFFYPLVNDISSEPTVLGTFVLILGLAGAIVLFKTLTAEHTKIIFIGLGFGLIAASLYAIMILTGRA